MDDSELYRPLKGDLVSMQGQHSATFEVTAIHRKNRSADLRMVGADYSKSEVPWTLLMLVERKKRKSEDFSRAAARIVREATEKG